eukprot:Awhi_evm1s1367
MSNVRIQLSRPNGQRIMALVPATLLDLETLILDKFNIQLEQPHEDEASSLSYFVQGALVDDIRYFCDGDLVEVRVPSDTRQLTQTDSSSTTTHITTPFSTPWTHEKLKNKSGLVNWEDNIRRELRLYSLYSVFEVKSEDGPAPPVFNLLHGETRLSRAVLRIPSLLRWNHSPKRNHTYLFRSSLEDSVIAKMEPLTETEPHLSIQK